MARPAIIEKLLANIDDIHELGRQRAFELGNPFYAKYEGDEEYYTKELPTGERYLVTVKIIFDDNGFPVRVEDTIIFKKTL